MENICYNCFSDSLNDAGICEKCGFDGAKNREKYPLALPLGSILYGRYIVGRVLGQGGFGITYLAQDYQTKGLVAIKEFFPDSMATRTEKITVCPLSGERGENFAYGLNSFLEEAKTMAEFIGNPNITRVDSYFEENGTGYFVMEYLDGDSFLDYIKSHGGRISWEDTMKVALPIMDALAAMHEKGIIHRDVTPDNIYITKDGTVKLLDFGAARYSLGNVSRSLDVILKHGFAPKEQYSRHGRQGPYTDVYSLGATIYYAITGVKPDDSIERSDEDNLPLPTTLGAKISIAQEETLLKALAVAPADRYQSMPEFRAAITAPKTKTDTKSETKSKSASAKKLPKWRIPRAATGVCALVLLAALGSGKSEQPRKAQAETSRPESQEVLIAVETTPPPESQEVLIAVETTSPPESQEVLIAVETTPPTESSEVHFMAMMDKNVASQGNQPFWGQTEYPRAQVEQVVFQDTLAGAPDSAWDVSAIRNRSVLAWMKGSTLTVAADGLISPNVVADNLFKDFINLKAIDFGGCFDTSQVTSMERMFYDCKSLASLDVSCFDTSQVTSMEWMFYHCKSLASLDVSCFDTANVTNMRSMFRNCNSLTQLDLSGLDTSKVTDMGDMFDLCSKLTSLDVSGFDTSHVTNMSDMFSYCDRLAHLDVSGFDTSNVTDMSSMFSCCFDLTSLDLSGFDTSHVTDMALMFFGCRNLTHLDLSNFDTANVTSMKSMFGGCEVLTSLNLSGFHAGNDTKLADMFTDCSSLTNLQCTDSAILNAYKKR